MSPSVHTKKKDLIELIDEDIVLAETVTAWGVKLKDREDLGDYLYNLSVCFANKMVSYKETGLVASAIVAYKKDNDFLKKREYQKEEAESSDYFGEIKVRGDYTLTLVEVKEWGSDWGTTHFLRFKDDLGNIAVWYASKSLGLEFPKEPWRFEEVNIGDKIVLKATVKEHGEFKGAKQTVLTRGKVVSIVEKVMSEEVK